MDAQLQFGAGFILAVAGWLLPRAIAGTMLRCHPSLPLDTMLPMAAWLLVFAITARPVFAGLVVLLLCAAFAIGDRAKRAILHEPVVFSDIPQFVQVFRHPRLIVPIGARGWLFGGLVVIAALFAVILFFEPMVWRYSPWPAILVVAITALLGWAVAQPPLLPRCVQALKKLKPEGVPVSDATRFGPLALLIVYGMIARAERPLLRAQVVAPPPIPRKVSNGSPILLVQCESFFDARRLHPAIPRDLLSSFDSCCESSRYFGRLAVPGWGANTTRAEFAALTGLSEDALGFDRFNPYYAFARRPIASLAWKMRERGYRTLCIHPFDRTFFRRDRVMTQLGFDTFLGEEAFTGARREGLYIGDAEVARCAVEFLRDQGPRVFIFIITMENHGPWDPDGSCGSAPDPAPELPAFPGSELLKSYLARLRGADAMIGILRSEIEARDPGGLLAFYGDHLPSLPATFEQLGFADTQTDYVIWKAGRGVAQRRDLAVHQLPRIISDVAQATEDNCRVGEAS